jgi:hypothetical protein
MRTLEAQVLKDGVILQEVRWKSCQYFSDCDLVELLLSM